MNHRIQPILMLALLSSLILHPSSLARADGGAVRLRQRAGGYQIAVFTSPTPLRAGPVDVSVLVQDAATGECVPEAQVTVCLKAPGAGRTLECPATTEAATNRLFHAAVFELPEPGWWDVEIAVEGPHGPALLRFGVEADGPGTSLAGVMAVVHVAGPRGRSLRPSPGTGSAEDSSARKLNRPSLAIHAKRARFCSMVLLRESTSAAAVA